MDRKKSKLYAAILSKAVRANRPMQNDSPNPFVKLFIALCVVLIANCHEQENISQNSSLDMSSKINIGMSESEVIDLLGSPTNRFTPPDADWTTLSYLKPLDLVARKNESFEDAGFEIVTRSQKVVAIQRVKRDVTFPGSSEK